MEPMAYIGAGMCALSMMAAAWGRISGLDDNYFYCRTQPAG